MRILVIHLSTFVENIALTFCYNGANYAIAKTKWISRYMLAPPRLHTDFTGIRYNEDSILHIDTSLFNHELRPSIRYLHNSIVIKHAVLNS